ncbi:MAG: tryptophan synthase subunit alpha [Deltaproteobacteria bacterium]|nr:tryptophan synthase subunit alpha [Deltaproteobacteria bacterium]
MTKTLNDLRKKNKKAFIPFLTCGDPSPKITEDAIDVLVEQGATLIELGMPFSDPMADGPTIQKSSERALANGMTLQGTLELVKWVRTKHDIPLLLMGYYNPILHYGLKKFAKDAKNAGVNALLIVDLPVEESEELRTHLKDSNIDLIYLLTPTSTKERIQLVNQFGSGFVYYVSFTGTTGAQSLNTTAVKKNVLSLKKQIKLPINVGFGISTKQDIKAVQEFADGAVVGSAIVKMIEQASQSNNFKSNFKKELQKLF